ncbi:hypothetical protein NMY22_g7276 [Coprinellus aureogranulatus]|nr:hypothetical protein NMY22_g7276 [Coprinellus aureogranulatus]
MRFRLAPLPSSPWLKDGNSEDERDEIILCWASKVHPGPLNEIATEDTSSSTVEDTLRPRFASRLFKPTERRWLSVPALSTLVYPPQRVTPRRRRFYLSPKTLSMDPRVLLEH